MINQEALGQSKGAYLQVGLAAEGLQLGQQLGETRSLLLVHRPRHPHDLVAEKERQGGVD